MSDFGAGGTCGWQHNNTRCVPQETRSCCSVNGFCGSNETYCFTRYGCQSDCVDPPAFYLSSTPSPTPTPTPTTATSTAISTAVSTELATQTATATPTAAASSSGLTKAQISGIIAGSILFLLAVLIIVFFYLYKRRKTRPAVLPSNNQSIVYRREEANGTVHTLEFPQSFARQNPNMVQRALGETPTGPFRAIGGPSIQESTNNGRYMNDPDDYRFQDVGSDRSSRAS